MVIAITGVVIAMVAIFIVPSITAYFSSSTRAQLGDEADTALRRMTRDLAAALPNSVRITSGSNNIGVELIPVSAAARYAVGSEAGDPLVFGNVSSPDTSFAIVGPALKLSAGNQRLAWYNLGNGVPDADAYTLANVRVASNAAGNVSNVSNVNISGAALPVPLQAAPYRVYAIEQPVTYRCDTAAGTLTRYTGYGFQTSQPNPPSGGSVAVLARRVQSCSFSYDTPAITARYALVTLSLQLGATSSGGNEVVTLYHTVHVDNLP